jgi:hypothetical protein
MGSREVDFVTLQTYIAYQAAVFELHQVERGLIRQAPARLASIHQDQIPWRNVRLHLDVPRQPEDSGVRQAIFHLFAEGIGSGVALERERAPGTHQILNDRDLLIGTNGRTGQQVSHGEFEFPQNPVG